MNRFVRAALATAGGAVLLALTATPANAYSGPVYQGNDFAFTEYINDDIVYACDAESDGHRVYTEYYLNNGSFRRVDDVGGSNGVCEGDDWTQTPYWVSRYRVCETTVGCSGWKTTDGLGGNSVKAGDPKFQTPRPIQAKG